MLQVFLPLNTREPIFIASVSLAFLIKTPIYLFHMWLPKAHVEAPTGGSILLAGILLKIGGIGFLVFKHIVPRTTLVRLLYSLNIFFNIYAASCCIFKTDMKEIVAYSSISHISSILILITISTSRRRTPARIIIVSHGLCASGLFFLVGILFKNSNTRNLVLNKGAMKNRPGVSLFCFFFFLQLTLLLP